MLLGSILKHFLPLFFWTRENYKLFEAKNGDDFGSGFQKEHVGSCPKLNCMAIKENPLMMRKWKFNAIPCVTSDANCQWIIYVSIGFNMNTKA